MAMPPIAKVLWSLFKITVRRGVARNLLGGQKRGLRDGSPPAGSRGRALGGLGPKPPEAGDTC